MYRYVGQRKKSSVSSWIPTTVRSGRESVAGGSSRVGGGWRAAAGVGLRQCGTGALHTAGPALGTTAGSAVLLRRGAACSHKVSPSRDGRTLLAAYIYASPPT